jgi:chromosome segregation ATPase
MKNLVLSAALILVVLASCTGPSATELKQKTDSLYLALADKDRELNGLVDGLSEINANLAQIKEKENIISLNASEAQGNQAVKEQINQDIKMIYDLMVQNQEKIAELEKQLRGTNRDNANMRKLIASLNEQLAAKNEEIVRLTEELQRKNIQIDQLNFVLGSTRESLDSLGRVQTQTADDLNQTTTELNKAFYVVGSSKELKDWNVVNSDGFLAKKKVLNEDVDNSKFTEVDIRDTEKISIDKKKAKVKVLTSHPENSYKIETAADGTVSVVITDKKQFWSVSKFLVLQIS